jgi:hypothetical protein
VGAGRWAHGPQGVACGFQGAAEGKKEQHELPTPTQVQVRIFFAQNPEPKESPMPNAQSKRRCPLVISRFEGRHKKQKRQPDAHPTSAPARQQRK